MKLRSITVHAGRTYPHPFIGYANLRPGVSMTAILEDGDNVVACVRRLQAAAEAHVEADLLAVRYAIQVAKQQTNKNNAEDIATQILSTVKVMDLIREGQLKVAELKKEYPDLIQQMTIKPGGEYAPGEAPNDFYFDEEYD